MSLLAALSLLTVNLPPQAMFGDWIAGCDNHRLCEAIALPRPTGDEDRQVPDWSLDVVRGPAAAGWIEVSLSTGFEDGPERMASLNLRLDGKAAPFRWDAYGEVKRDGMAMLRALAVAKKAEVIAADGTTVIAELPVEGAAAALRWIDAQQRRDGTVTAIVAVGPGPASAVPPPPMRPTINAARRSSTAPPTIGRAQWLAAQKRGGDLCEAERAGGDVYRLDANTSLALAGCMMGAYQGASLAFLVDNRGRMRPAPIEWTAGTERQAIDAIWITGGDYDPKDGILYSSAKVRGIGDCWETASWVWDGKAFRLANYRLLDECRGAQAGSALPRWQTANVPSATPDERDGRAAAAAAPRD